MHKVQVAEPGTLLVGYAHGLHSVSPATLNVPAGQGTQRSIDIDPRAGLYVPGGHGVQAVALVEFIYVPRGQRVQPVCPVLGLYLPIGHGMQTADVALIGLYVPTGQLLQDSTAEEKLVPGVH